MENKEYIRICERQFKNFNNDVIKNWLSNNIAEMQKSLYYRDMYDRKIKNFYLCIATNKKLNPYE